MLLNVEDFRRQARRVLPAFVFDYVDGGADDGHCLKRNRADLDAVTLVPRVLRDTTAVDTSVEVFGSQWRFPVGVAPMGLNGLVRSGGDAMLAMAARNEGTTFLLSTASNMPLEDVRRMAPDGVQWMQLYVMHRTVARRIVERAQKAGYQALVLTVDVPVGGNREADRRNGFGVPFRLTPRLVRDLIAHPVWSMRAALAGTPAFPNVSTDPNQPVSPQVQAALLSRAMDQSVVWETLSWLREYWKGPLLLKGVLHPDDARLALEHGVDGLIVSNHGGRQLDAAPSAIEALRRIAPEVNGRIPIFMDGGVRRGTDVARALSLGATAVFVGRPALYGLAVSGQCGAEAVLKTIREELIRTMTLLGCSQVGDLRQL